MKISTKFLIGSIAILLGFDLAVWLLYSLRPKEAMLTILFLTVLLIAVFNLWFGKLVTSGLTEIIGYLSKQDSDERLDSTASENELTYLKASFGHLNRYVRTARKGSGLEPNFVGRYVVEKPIMAGSMSWLYKGGDSQTTETVWLKIPFDNILINPIYASCVRSERKLYERMRHSGLPGLKDRVGDVLIFEALEGESFEKYLRRNAPFSKMDVLPIFQQLCDVVSYLHHQGVVHHNLRPESMLVTKDRQLRLTDLGLAFSSDIPDALSQVRLTSQGDKRYMAPEQLSGKRGDPRSDIHTLGVLLYRMLSEELPPEIRHISPGIKSVIAKALEPDPEKRYQWVEDFWDDLQTKVFVVEIYV